MVLGDLNEDGQLDGFVAGCCGMSFSHTSGEEVYLPSISWVWINVWNPGGWFEYHTYGLEQLHDLPIREAGLGDLNGDGSLDIFAAIQAPKPGRDSLPADLVLLNDGSGRFTDSGQRLGETDSSSVALGDLDADGDLDALIAGFRQAATWWNDGQAAFTRSRQRFSYSKRHGLAVGDFNGDGRPDIFAAAYSKEYRVWFNQGDGTFQTAPWP